MAELLIDFITTLDGYGAAEGWPGWWGLEGPEYLVVVGRAARGGLHGPDGRHHLPRHVGIRRRGRARHGCAGGHVEGRLLVHVERAALVGEHATRGRGRRRCRAGDEGRGRSTSMRTMGSLTLCRSLLSAGLADRFRVVVFPVITREHRPGADLRRLSRRRARDDQQPHLRRSHPTARVRPDGSG